VQRSSYCFQGLTLFWGAEGQGRDASGLPNKPLHLTRRRLRGPALKRLIRSDTAEELIELADEPGKLDEKAHRTR
jgi:hypothetical protein